MFSNPLFSHLVVALGGAVGAVTRSVVYQWYAKLNDFRHSRKLIRGRPQRAIIAPMGASQNPCSLA